MIRATVLLVGMALSATAALGACSGPISRPQFSAVLRFSAEAPPLPVVLSDETGQVTGIASAASDPGATSPDLAARADPADPNAFIVSWLGGGCDSDASLTFKRHEADYVLNVAVHGRFAFPGGCTAEGIPRDVRIVTSSPIPLDAIVVAGHT